MDTSTNDYLLELPDPVAVRERFSSAVEYWSTRDNFIRNVRTHLNGLNEIKRPPDGTFIGAPVHTYILQSVINEKSARFLLQPRHQVIAAGEGPTARTASSQIENGLNAIQYWAERNGDGDVWLRMVQDAISFDIAVERIECAPAAHWPEIARSVTLVVDGEELGEREELYAKFLKSKEHIFPFEDDKEEYEKYREEYKRSNGIPIRSIYVAPDAFFPIYEGSVIVEAFERDERSLRDVLRQPLYSPEAVARISGAAAGLTERQKITKKVVILHYANAYVHAYYALIPGGAENRRAGQAQTDWPRGISASTIGEPVLLHWYPHNLGRVPYNVVSGRYGGWKTNINSIERVMNGLCELSQATDQLASQVATNIENLYWPTLVEELSPEHRDADSDGKPKATKKGKPGTTIPIWKGESISVLRTSQPNPEAQWFFSTLTSQIEKLSGSAAIYGQQDPGVRTGYHAHLQISQSEHLDEMLEAHLVSGAINRAMIYLMHIREMGEKIEVYHRYTMRNGQKVGRKTVIDPKKLKHLPELDAAVRKPKPIDYDSAIRVAMQASQDLQGPGTPLLDWDTIQERILGEDSPDVIEQKIAIQNEKRKILDSGFVSTLIAQRLAALLIEEEAPSIGDSQAETVDPALMGAAGNMIDPSLGAGGISPDLLLALQRGGMSMGVDPLQPGAMGPPAIAVPPGGAVPTGVTPGGAPPPSGIPQIEGQDVGGGPAPYRPQPEQNAARAIQAAMQAR